MQKSYSEKWKKSMLNFLTRKLDKTGSTDRAKVSGHRRSV